MQQLVLVAAFVVVVGAGAASIVRLRFDPSPALAVAIGVAIGLLAGLLVVQGFADVVPDSAEGTLDLIAIVAITVAIAVVSLYRWTHRA